MLNTVLNTVLNTLARCEPTWIGFKRISLGGKAAARVNKMTFLTKCAATVCTVTGHFMTQRTWGKHSPSLVIWINLHHQCIFYHPVPKFVGWYMALFRSLFFPLTSPAGVFPCDPADWWPPSHCLTSRVRMWRALWLGELWEHFQTLSFCFPLFFCSLSKTEVWTQFLTLFDFDRKTTLGSWFSSYILVSLGRSVGTWHVLLWIVGCVSGFCMLEGLQPFLFLLLLIFGYIGVLLHRVFSAF